jgi:hypothetical protein
MENIEYKDIPEHYGYQVSRCGLVRTIDRTIKHKNGKIFNLKGRNISLKKPKDEVYYQVTLYSNNKQKTVRIHRLVALTWLNNPNNLPLVNHKDGNKLNNHVDNLEWSTYVENLYHCKNILGKNLNISLTKINELYEFNSNLDLLSFINLLKQNCK